MARPIAFTPGRAERQCAERRVADNEWEREVRLRANASEGVVVRGRLGGQFVDRRKLDGLTSTDPLRAPGEHVGNALGCERHADQPLSCPPVSEHGLLVRTSELSDGAAVDVQGFADTLLRVLDGDVHVTRRQVNEGRRQIGDQPLEGEAFFECGAQDGGFRRHR